MDVIAILDVGKTNKKLLLFDQHYRIVLEQSRSFAETRDEDGDPCEDLSALTEWVNGVLVQLNALVRQKGFRIRAINFSAYGASFVHIGQDGKPVAPLYNYLKPFPAALREQFYAQYGGEAKFSQLTASPVLGSLNSGMQLYRIRKEQPALFSRIRYSLHLPQYLSYLLTGHPCSEITSIGCHTALWNFPQGDYHEWVRSEAISDKLPPIADSTAVFPMRLANSAAPSATPTVPALVLLQDLKAGIGLHDSSAAIIPYLSSFREPFVLLSTGTWCISMNPFNHIPLTTTELQQDCLCYISYQGKPVKASRLFAGHEHEQQVKRLATHFGKSRDYHTAIVYDPAIIARLRVTKKPGSTAANAGTIAEKPGVIAEGPGPAADMMGFRFSQQDLSQWETYEEAYHSLLMDIMDQQVVSTSLILQGTPVTRIFVDGGFGRNQVYMHLLADAFPAIEVYAASIPQATAMGAALAIHSHWNPQPMPTDIIGLKYYKAG